MDKGSRIGSRGESNVGFVFLGNQATARVKVSAPIDDDPANWRVHFQKEKSKGD